MRREHLHGEEVLVLVFSPKQTLADAEACRMALLHALDGARHVLLDAGDVETVDLSFLQTLTAFQQTTCHRGFTVGWAERPSPVVRAAAEAFGFVGRPFGKASEGAEFWRECRP